jgi:hypothetical protein
MRYKTLNESTAHALVRHWATLAISCQVSTTDAPHFYEVVTIPGDLPMNDNNAPAVVTLWREICDAFVAGRVSLTN